MANDKHCDNCFYYKMLSMNGVTRCCHYILITGHKRPCGPGKDCTVKVALDVKRKKGAIHGKG
jgi:hypothetical protein